MTPHEEATRLVEEWFAEWLDDADAELEWKDDLVRRLVPIFAVTQQIGCDISSRPVTSFGARRIGHGR